MPGLKFKQTVRQTIGDTLIQYFIHSVDNPLVITFSPAGAVLSKQDEESQISPWSFDFFHKQEMNILSFACIEHKDWFRSKQLAIFLEKLAPQLQCFPERLGYGASMGAYAVILHAQRLQIDRALLLSPISSIIDGQETFCQADNQEKYIDLNDWSNVACQLTVIYDSFCANDKEHARRFASHHQFLRFPGVGHQVIESLNNIGYLKPLVLQFIQGDVKLAEFAKAIRKRRNIERYYSYMKRNPTKKLSKQKLKFIKRTFIFWQLCNLNQITAKFKRKWGKSLKKRTRNLK